MRLKSGALVVVQSDRVFPTSKVVPEFRVQVFQRGAVTLFDKVSNTCCPIQCGLPWLVRACEDPAVVPHQI